MIDYAHTLHANTFAALYGEGTFNSEVYSAPAQTSTTPQTTVPSAPNTGFFQTTFSGASEVSLIPILFLLAIGVGAITVGINRVVRRRAHQRIGK